MIFTIRFALRQSKAFSLLIIVLSLFWSHAYGGKTLAPKSYTQYSINDVGRMVLEARNQRGTINQIAQKTKHFPGWKKIKTTVATGVSLTGSAVGAFRQQSGPVQLLEVMMLVTSINYMLDTGLAIGGNIRYAYRKLFPEEGAEARTALREVMHTHYQSGLQFHLEPMVDLLVDAVPVKDLRIVSAEFLILNLDTKLAAFCDAQGISEVSLFYDEENVEQLKAFISHVLHYRSGDETIIQLINEMELRLAEAENQKSIYKEKFYSVEEYCSYRRWQGKYCMIHVDDESGYKVGRSEGFSIQNRPSNVTRPDNAILRGYQFFPYNIEYAY